MPPSPRKFDASQAGPRGALASSKNGVDSRARNPRRFTLDLYTRTIGTARSLVGYVLWPLGKARTIVVACALLAISCAKSVQAPVAYYVPLQGGGASRLRALACFDRCSGLAACVGNCPGIEVEEDATCSELPRSSYSACTEHVTTVSRIDVVGLGVATAVAVGLSVAILVGLSATTGESED
jgi:hypothetical protein